MHYTQYTQHYLQRKRQKSRVRLQVPADAQPEYTDCRHVSTDQAGECNAPQTSQEFCRLIIIKVYTE